MLHKIIHKIEFAIKFQAFYLIALDFFLKGFKFCRFVGGQALKA